MVASGDAITRAVDCDQVRRNYAIIQTGFPQFPGGLATFGVCQSR